ncbi:hypothetical protein K461DRAFT_323616 [Myriangium duriaei CBS 260.36]|uniref:Rhodopsin domain-containing protein n=1 Tax=Myriangium duriaei CBS 260.36 TaxID=1168546 RepID=A0A9P4MEH1_9PEZI|nr:hypothetical protein K461DRAFT_323616 [Myriangium duriaei CBS 260.36]
MPPIRLPPLSSLPQQYVNEYGGDVLRDTAIAFMVLEIFFVSLRFVSKRVGRNPYGIDDWLVAASLVLCTSINISEFLFIDIGGVGRHQLVVAITAPHELTNFGKLVLVVPILYLAAVCLPRVAILVFYLRIFTLGRQRTATWAIMIVIIATAVGGIIAGLVQCIPLNYVWNKSVEGHCFDTTAYYRYASLPNTITDVFMILLPIPAVWSLHTSRSTKIGLTITFLTGSVGFIAALVRTVRLFETDATYHGTIDHTWSAVDHNLWVVIEPGCYLFASSFVTLRPLLNHINSKVVEGQLSQRRFRSFSSLRSLFHSRDRSNAYPSTTSVELPEMPVPNHNNVFRAKMVTKVEDREDQEMLVTV